MVPNLSGTRDGFCGRCGGVGTGGRAQVSFAPLPTVDEWGLGGGAGTEAGGRAQVSSE